MSFEQGLVGSLTPPTKLLYSMASGQESFTGKDIAKMTRGPSMLRYLPRPIKKAIGAEDIETKSGYKFTKLPWQAAMALREQPLTVQFRTFDTMHDENRGLLTKSISLLTGMRVVEIDEEYELKRRIRDHLISKVKAGEVGEFAKFFATGDTSPELAALIKDYYKVGRKPH